MLGLARVHGRSSVGLTISFSGLEISSRSDQGIASLEIASSQYIFYIASIGMSAISKSWKPQPVRGREKTPSSGEDESGVCLPLCLEKR